MRMSTIAWADRASAVMHLPVLLGHLVTRLANWTFFRVDGPSVLDVYLFRFVFG